VLDLADVHTYYGNIRALRGISLCVQRGEIVTLIGANGAGKTTTLRTILGTVRPHRGTVTFDGRRLDTLPTDRIVRLGIAQSPEGRRIFPRMTVLENLELGAFVRPDRGAIAPDLERVFTLFPRLRERATQKGGTLSGGEQQMLAMARALMARPSLLLLDEPSMGLSPILVETIFRIVEDINRQGTTILLVEQNARMALRVARRGYVIQTGRIVLHDAAPELLRPREEDVSRREVGEGRVAGTGRTRRSGRSQPVPDDLARSRARLGRCQPRATARTAACEPVAVASLDGPVGQIPLSARAPLGAIHAWRSGRQVMP
jgi:branched-chain amino acid transport system ATP-binding protein